MALVHAILTVLVEQPCSGYDLRKKFEGSVGFFWRASFQQIYRELTKLEEQGLLQAQAIHQESRPDKKIYSVTEAGQQYLSQWIAQPSEVSPLKDDLLVKLFAGYLVPQDTILAELEQHRQQHLQQLAVYQAIEQQYFQNSDTFSRKQQFHYITLRQGIRYETEWLNWCQEAIEFLQ
ncbi:MAG: PadR family transcriptional regulator [Drouetiella hepatica Uher 2000/2452]|jgi:DNA-binding PadR family transcriptional regulator|uniref:PadR family transcriptional regulator n=1 Tax=Drouetiella hepatica Uher 2000/2452 TaxID=904376 RepID=A0A951QE95_9CYAN|nr:PadR family transcriptional regulator [Drouetiella hepatica Uher 2000/2452]